MPRRPKPPPPLPPNASEEQALIHRFLTDNPEIPMSRWAKASGLSDGTIRRLLKVDRGVMQDDTFKKLNEGARQLTGEPLRSKGRSKAFLVGRVGMGAMIQMIDGSGDQITREVVQYPPAVADIGDLEAVRVEGNAMFPLAHGFLIYFKRENNGVTDAEMGALCVIGIREGGTCVGYLRRGYEAGRFNIEKWGAETLIDQDVEWAARIVSIVQPQP